MASVEPLLESAALGVAITLDIETAPATSAYAWPSAPTRARAPVRARPRAYLAGMLDRALGGDAAITSP